MKLGLNHKGKDFTLGPGCIIGFYKKERLITILLDKTRECVKWRNGDDKCYPPHAIKTEKDFLELVIFLSEIIGCQIDRHDWPYGPAYLLK